MNYPDSDTDSQASAALSPTAVGPSPKSGFPAAVCSAASPVAFVLSAAKQTLRVYTIENVVSANRTTLRKIQSEQDMVAVQPFVTPQNSPGVLCLSDRCFLQVSPCCHFESACSQPTSASKVTQQLMPVPARRESKAGHA